MVAAAPAGGQTSMPSQLENTLLTLPPCPVPVWKHSLDAASMPRPRSPSSNPSYTEPSTAIPAARAQSLTPKIRRRRRRSSARLDPATLREEGATEPAHESAPTPAARPP
eukprot:343756-Pleurochrysis_carterae.AAC.2